MSIKRFLWIVTLVVVLLNSLFTPISYAWDMTQMVVDDEWQDGLFLDTLNDNNEQKDEDLESSGSVLSGSSEIVKNVEQFIVSFYVSEDEIVEQKVYSWEKVEPLNLESDGDDCNQLWLYHEKQYDFDTIVTGNISLYLRRECSEINEEFENLLYDVQNFWEWVQSWDSKIQLMTTDIEKHKVKYVFDDIAQFDWAACINTDLKLFSSDNQSRNFDLNFVVDNLWYVGNQSNNRNTLFSTVYENTNLWYPWLNFRISWNGWNYELEANWITTSNFLDRSVKNIAFSRIWSWFYNGDSLLDKTVTKTFDTPLTFGCSLDDRSRYYRFLSWTLLDIGVAVQYDSWDIITFPSPVKSYYLFWWWSTEENWWWVIYPAWSSFVVNDDITLYAIWIDPYDEGYERDGVKLTYNFSEDAVSFDWLRYLNTQLWLFSNWIYWNDYELSLKVDRLGWNNWITNTLLYIMNGGRWYSYSADNINNFRFNWANFWNKSVQLQPSTVYIQSRKNILKLENTKFDYRNLALYNEPLIIWAQLNGGSLSNFFNWDISNITFSIWYPVWKKVTLPIPVMDGYIFEWWYDSLWNKIENSLNLSEDTILTAKWSEEQDYEELKARSFPVTYVYGNSLSFTWNSYINTDLKLFSSDDYLKDFEFSLWMDKFIYSEQPNNGTIFSLLYESSSDNYPWILLRRDASKSNLVYQIRNNSNSSYISQTLWIWDFKISRYNQKIFVGDVNKVYKNDMKWIKKFDIPLSIGNVLNTNWVPFEWNDSRYISWVLSNVEVKVWYDPLEEFDLPQPSWKWFTFMNWYKDQDFTILATSTNVESWDVLYAKWKELSQDDPVYYTVTFINWEERKEISVVSWWFVEPPEITVPVWKIFSWWYYTWMKQKFDFENTVISGDLDLYACFIKSSFTVNFYDENKTTILTWWTYDYNDQIVSWPEIWEKDRAVFSWWYYLSWNKEIYVSFPLNVDKSMDLFQKWKSIYTVTFNSDWWTLVQSQDVIEWEFVEEPETPFKNGYSFNWWELNNQQFNFNTPITNNIELTAKWTANTTTPYKVEYYKQNPNDNGYTFAEKEDLTWTTDERATVPEKNYDWFDTRSYASAKIAWNGSTVIEVKYDRAEYAITFDMDWWDALAPLTGRYEQSLTAPETSELNKQGYEFWWWEPNFPEKMPLGWMALKALWTSKWDTEYTVKHLFENLNGDYTEKPEHPEEKKTWTTNAQTDAQAKTIAGFTAQPITQWTIKADWSTVVEVRYDRTVYNVSYLSDNETKYTTGVKYGHTIPRIIPISLTKPWYQFQEWTWVIEMPSNDVVLNAVWSPDTQTLTVNHYVMWVDWTYSNTPKDVDSTQTWKTDTQIAALIKDYGEWFVLSWAEKTVTLEPENNVVDYYYIRKQYPVTLLQSRWVKEVKITPQTTSGYYYYEQPITISAELEEWYNWSNWTWKKSSEQQVITIQEQSTWFKVPVWWISLIANAEIQKYTVIFKNEDGTELSKTEYDYWTLPENIQRPTNPSKTATAEYTYSFVWWEPEIAKVTKDVEYTATYAKEKNKYTITWKNDDWTIIDTTEVEYGIEPTHVSPSKVWYTFAWWNPALASVDWDKTYTATYNVNKYKVILVKWKGIAELYGWWEYDYNTTISYTWIVKAWYHFDDWSIIKTFTQTIPANNIAITVNADPNNYYVQFRKNGWVGEMENQRFIYDQTWTLNPNKFSRDWYTFVWWTNGEWWIYKDKWEVYNLATSGVVYLIAQWLEWEIDPQPTPTPTPTPTPSPSWWSSGWWRIINNEVKEQEHSSAEENTWDIVEKDENKQTDSWIKTWVNEELWWENNKTIIDENTKKEQQVRSQEELDAYKYAYKYWITTLASKEAARPDEYVQRWHMANMVVNYALSVLHRKLPEEMPKKCRWLDWTNAWESQEIKEYAEKACALWLMWVDMKYFQPYKLVTRAQFGTIMWRLLWWKLVSKPYYAGHLSRLKENWIMTQIDNPEDRIEIRKRAWLMFMRSEKYFKVK